MASLTPQIIFHLFGLPIRSSVLASWLAMAIILITIFLFDRFKPHALEGFVDFLITMIAGIMQTDSINKYLPLLGTLFIFIAVANSLGALPLLTAPTSDINTTIALALVTFFAVYAYGISTKGLKRYLKEFASPLFLLPLELIGQVSRTVSLSLRLFGNTLSGELITAIVFSLIPLLMPLPLMGLSLLIGILQAYVFTALASVYIATGIAQPDKVPSEKERIITNE